MIPHPSHAAMDPAPSSPNPPARERRIYRVATIPGDGIGSEVISAGTTVLRALASALDYRFELEIKSLDWGSERYKKEGGYIPEGGLRDLRKHDAVMFGAVGDRGERIFAYLGVSSVSAHGRFENIVGLLLDYV